MKVTVVIPAHNAGRFIGRTLESVLAQTHPATQVIVVDDGSSDRTSDVVRSFGAPVELVAGPCRGVSAARNEGVRRAGGDGIAFMDHDDLWERSKLARQVEVLAARPRAALVFTQAQVVRDGVDGEIFPVIPEPERFLASAYENLAHWNYVPMSAVMVRRSALEALAPPAGGGDGPFDTRYRYAEDWDLWLRIAAVAGPGGIACIAEPLTRYVIVPGRATERMADLRLEDIDIFSRQLRDRPALRSSDPARCRATLHRLHQEAGYWLLKEGRRREARRLLGAAWRMRPAALKPLAYLMASFLGRGAVMTRRSIAEAPR